MVNTFTFGTSLAPGVSLTQTILDVVPAPLTNHAIAYMFVTVPGSSWEASPDNYSELEPLVPVAISSTADYLEKIGGVIPNPAIDYEAYVSYKSVEAFYANSGGSGVLYVIRTVVTPQIKLQLDDVTEPLVATNNYFTLKVDGVYYGDTDAGFNDLAGDPVRWITTTGLDLADNTFDIVDFLKSNEDFNLAYDVIEVENQFTNGLIYFASRQSGVIPVVENFLSSSTTPPTVFGDFSASGLTITTLSNKREVSFKLEHEETVYVVDGSLFDSEYYGRLDGALDSNPGEFTNFNGVDDVTLDIPQFSAILNRYLIDELGVATSVIHTGTASGTNGKGQTYTSVAVADLSNTWVAIPDNDGPFTARVETAGGLESRDLDNPAADRIVYYTPTDIGGGEITWAPVATGATDLDLMPQSVQQYSLLVNEPNNRVVITTNGATIDEHEDDLQTKLATAINDTNYIITETPTITRGYETNVDPAAVLAVPRILSGDETRGFYSWDIIASLEIESTTNVPIYLWPATSPSGVVEHKLLNVISVDSEALDTSDDLDSGHRVNDYVYTIRNGVSDVELLPGFLLCPEAYALFDASRSGDPNTTEVERRIAISSALNEVARARNWFALVDDRPASTGITQSAEEFNALIASVGAAQGHYGFYYPFVKGIDQFDLPASPYVAGVALNRYTTESFSEPPAGPNYPLQGALRPIYTLNRPQLEVNSPRGMNAIVTIPNSGVVVYGARTTATNTPVQFVNSRIVTNVTLQALSDSFETFPFSAIRTNNVSLFNAVRVTATNVLQDLYSQGALLGETPEDAYLVICNNTNNSNVNLAQGVVFCDIVIAPASTLERLVIRTTVTTAGQVQSAINL